MLTVWKQRDIIIKRPRAGTAKAQKSSKRAGYKYYQLTKKRKTAKMNIRRWCELVIGRSQTSREDMSSRSAAKTKEVQILMPSLANLNLGASVLRHGHWSLPNIRVLRDTWPSMVIENWTTRKELKARLVKWYWVINELDQSSVISFMESLILAQDERWRRA